MTITVYTLPACVQCETTKRYLEKQEIEFNTVDISSDADAAELVRGLGYTQAPVVVVETDERAWSWSGFRLDRLQDMAFHYKKAEEGIVAA